MSGESRLGTVFIATGATVGAGVSTAVGGMGLVGGFGGVAVGATPVIGVGAIFGAAIYGATTALIDRDPLAAGFGGLGTLGGVGIAGTIGKMGLVAPKVGIAIGVGTLPMAVMGGVFGLAAYGVAKIIDSSIPETPIDAFDRQAARIDWESDYAQALMDLTLGDLKWTNIELELNRLAVEDELQALKQKIKGIPSINLDPQTAKSTSSTTANTHTPKAAPSIDRDVIKERIDKKVKPLSSETIQHRSPLQWQLVSTLNGHTGAINSLAFSPDGQKLVSGSDDRTVNLWGLATKNRLYSFFGASDSILAVSFSPNGNDIAGSSADRIITSWKVAEKQLLRSFLDLKSGTSHDNLINSIAYSPNGQTLASGSADRTIRLWYSGTGKIEKVLTGHTDTVFTLAYSPDGRTLASGSADCTIRLWQTDRALKDLILTGHSGWVNTIAYSPNGNILASGSNDCTVRIWDIFAGITIATHRHHQVGIVSLAISTDDRTIASLDRNGLLLIWDLKSGEILSRLTGKNCIKFSPDGKKLAVAKGAKIDIWQQKNDRNSLSTHLPLPGEWWENLGVNITD
jgi:WD40 repeat protein